MAIRILALLLVLCTPALAATKDETCGMYGELAEKIMLVRQSGKPLSALLEAMANGEDARVNKITRSMILQAYEMPQFATDEYRTSTAAEFRNTMELYCFKSAD